MLTKPQSPQLRVKWLAVLCALAIVLTYWQHRAHHSGQQSAPERAAKYVMWPLQSGVTGVLGWGRDVLVSLIRARSLAEENRKLKEQIDRLAAEKLQLHEYFLENKDLREKLGFAIAGEVKGVPARVISRSSTPGGPKVSIESLDGRELEVGNMVMTQKGLVGRVVAAQKAVGEVMLLTHSDHAVAGMAQRSREQGMIYAARPTDASEPLLQMEKVRGEADLRVGDVILTAGLSGIYPANVRIGTVIRVQTAPASSRALRAIIKPAADLTNITYVLVVRRAK